MLNNEVHPYDLLRVRARDLLAGRHLEKLQDSLKKSLPNEAVRRKAVA